MSLLTRIRRSVLGRPDDSEPSRLHAVPDPEPLEFEVSDDEQEDSFGPERRDSPRFRIPHRANVVSWGRKYRARVVDISRSGAAITARARMRIGEKTILTVHEMGRYRGTVLRQLGDGVAIRFDEHEARPALEGTAAQAVPSALRTTVDKRRFLRAETTAPASVISGGERIRCSLLDLSAGGTALCIEAKPAIAHTVILYIEQLGRMRGRITRHFAEGIAIEFDIEPSRRDRLTQQVVGLLSQKPA
jgi:PilZ domain